jgi:hypothetical protein
MKDVSKEVEMKFSWPYERLLESVMGDEVQSQVWWQVEDQVWEQTWRQVGGAVKL